MQKDERSRKEGVHTIAFTSVTRYIFAEKN
jgi:hypothetical protein